MVDVNVTLANPWEIDAALEVLAARYPSIDKHFRQFCDTTVRDMPWEVGERFRQRNRYQLWRRLSTDEAPDCAVVLYEWEWVSEANPDRGIQVYILAILPADEWDGEAKRLFLVEAD